MAGVKKSGRTKGAKGTKGSTKGRTGSKSRKEPAKTRERPRAPERTVVRIRELDPYRKCGPGTSVERLIRVDEEVAGRKEAHLVYHDRHGWYCEHGRTCHAVKHARKGVKATR